MRLMIAKLYRLGTEHNRAANLRMTPLDQQVPFPLTLDRNILH